MFTASQAKLFLLCLTQFELVNDESISFESAQNFIREVQAVIPSFGGGTYAMKVNSNCFKGIEYLCHDFLRKSIMHVKPMGKCLYL